MTPLGIHFIIIDCFVYYCWSFRSFCLVGSFVSFRSFCSGRFVGFACFVSFCSRFRLMFLNLVIARGNYQNQSKMPYISANRHIRNSSLNTDNTPFSNSCLFCTVKKKGLFNQQGTLATALYLVRFYISIKNGEKNLQACQNTGQLVKALSVTTHQTSNKI